MDQALSVLHVSDLEGECCLCKTAKPRVIDLTITPSEQMPLEGHPSSCSTLAPHGVKPSAKMIQEAGLEAIGRLTLGAGSKAPGRRRRSITSSSHSDVHVRETKAISRSWYQMRPRILEVRRGSECVKAGLVAGNGQPKRVSPTLGHTTTNSSSFKARPQCSLQTVVLASETPLHTRSN